MKLLKNKSEITAKNLKNNICDYKGFKLFFEESKKLYVIGNHFNSGVDRWCDTIEDVKESF